MTCPHDVCCGHEDDCVLAKALNPVRLENVSPTPAQGPQRDFSKDTQFGAYTANGLVYMETPLHRYAIDKAFATRLAKALLRAAGNTDHEQTLKTVQSLKAENTDLRSRLARTSTKSESDVVAELEERVDKQAGVILKYQQAMKDIISAANRALPFPYRLS